jgi:UTP-glucose-1-phosphate uridylyltransferase
VGDEPFAVLLGDDLIDARDALLTPMIEQCEKRSASIIALREVPFCVPMSNRYAVPARNARHPPSALLE